MFTPHIILVLFICKKSFLVITIVDNFTSFVKQHGISSIAISNVFYRGKDLRQDFFNAGFHSAEYFLIGLYLSLDVCSKVALELLIYFVQSRI